MCVRGDLSVVDFMDSFFSQSLNFAQPAEMVPRSAQSAEMDFKMHGYLSHEQNTLYVKKKKTRKT